jgi:hypothetical protein
VGREWFLDDEKGLARQIQRTNFIDHDGLPGYSLCLFFSRPDVSLSK